MNANVRVTWKGKLATRRGREAAKRAFMNATEYLLQETNKVAPLDEGTLTRSGNTDVQVTRKGVEASVYYDTPYAINLHEHPEYNFQNGREGKYLEKTMEEEADKVEDFLKTEYERAFR